MKTIKELHVLVGLPGSGKTTFANQYKDNYVKNQYEPSYGNNRGRQYADVIDYDNIYKIVNDPETGVVDRARVEKMSLPRLKYNILILDGLFITQNDVEWILSVCVNNPKFTEHCVVEKIVIDSWIPDQEACLWNDRGRRNVGATVSIKSLKPEKIDVKKIEEKFGIKTKLELHRVVRKPAYRIMAEENGVQFIKGNKYLESYPWCLGGESYSWSGTKSPIPSETPCNFDQFDELLEKICPNITFLQYKKIYAKCVAAKERDGGDYYSKYKEGYYQCDLEKLYEMLKEMGLYKIAELNQHNF